MPRSCCVFNCTNRASAGCLMFNIPRGKHAFAKNRRRLWLQAIRRADWDSDGPKGGETVCSAHFITGEPSFDCDSPDFVPSIFPHSSTRDGNVTGKLARATMVKCAVQGCINHSDLRPGEPSSRLRKRFFRFPKDKARVKVWLAALRETEREITDHHQICEDHFLSHHITPTGISPDAIPIMPPLEGPVSGWSSCDEQDEHPDQVEESGVAADDDFYDEDFEDDEEEEEEEEDNDDDDDDDDHSRACDGTLSINIKPQGQCLTGSLISNPNIYNMNQAKHVSKGQVQNRSDVALGRLTKRFMQLLYTAPNGVLDLNEVTRKLGTRKRRVYDITNVLTGIQLIKKTSKNKIQWMGPAAGSSFGNQWSPKTKADLLNLKSTEEALDWLIKDCAQQLFALTDLKDNADSAYVTYEDICKIDVFKDQTIIAIRAPEETKLEVPTPTEESIQIHLKGTRGPIHILTCETEGQSDAVDPANTKSQLVKPAYFLTLEESRIHTKPLISDVSSTVAAVQSA